MARAIPDEAMRRSNWIRETIDLYQSPDFSWVGRFAETNFYKRIRLKLNQGIHLPLVKRKLSAS
jgi:hypothetical protein